MIDVYGHFGTLFSYATVASFVVRLLREKNLLGHVHNFDPEWHPSFVEFDEPPTDTRNSHVMVFAAPRSYIGAIAKRYGKERSAIFSSPNTDRMVKEYVETTLEFGTVLAPSSWCALSLANGIDSLPFSKIKQRELTSGSEVVQVPLGVSDVYMKRMVGIEREPGSKVRVFHTGTDQGWPGRKGTEELLQAWQISKLDATAELTVHIPPALRRDALYLLADLGIEDSVKVIVGEERGTDDAKLNQLYSAADLVVQPSRCEGFGMMILAALVRGVPLLTTYVTGQMDFLRECPNRWMPIPTGPLAPLASENGFAPTIEPALLAEALARAVAAASSRRGTVGWKKPGYGTWGSVEGRWREWIGQWIEETT